MMLGRKSASAIAPAIQIQCLANSRRWWVTSTATVTANPKNSVECLFSRLSPANTPNHSQSRESPVRTIRAMTRMQPVQNSGSNAFIVIRLLITRNAGHNRMQSPARNCA